MIKIIVQGNPIETVVIEGHADYADYGKDIVCASASAIFITSVNAMIRMDEHAISYEENKLIIQNHTEEIDKLLDNLLDLLEELSRQYPKNIKIRRC